MNKINVEKMVSGLKPISEDVLEATKKLTDDKKTNVLMVLGAEMKIDEDGVETNIASLFHGNRAAGRLLIKLAMDEHEEFADMVLEAGMMHMKGKLISELENESE